MAVLGFLDSVHRQKTYSAGVLLVKSRLVGDLASPLQILVIWSSKRNAAAFSHWNEAHPVAFLEGGLERQPKPMEDFRRDADVGQIELSRRAVQTSLGEGESQCPIGAHDEPWRFTRRSVEPRWYIQRKYPESMLVAQGNQLSCASAGAAS